jgi:hypothetical protein
MLNQSGIPFTMKLTQLGQPVSSLSSTYKGSRSEDDWDLCRPEQFSKAGDLRRQW